MWFKNDYGYGACPQVLEALSRTNAQAHDGYGMDPCCCKAADMIEAECGRPVFVHFLEGGTQANATVIDALLRPWQSAIAAETGHINAHETGAVEHTGHKIEALPGRDFKLSAEAVRAKAIAWRDNPIREHFTEPKLVYLSQPTEMGTLYSRAELEAMRAACDELGLYLFIDGARLGYALGAPANDASLADIARCADVFYLGGTKCGALFGEAVVFTAEPLQRAFRASMKQNGAMAAKGWVLGVQFAALLEDGLYQRQGERAVRLALEIREAFLKAGIAPASESPTNQQFFLLGEAQCEAFSKAGFVFEDEGPAEGGLRLVRFCTSWATQPSEARALEAFAAGLKAAGRP